MSLSGGTSRFHNRAIRLPRDTKPLFLSGKDGLLSLPTSVDFRPTRNFEGRPVVRAVPTVSPSSPGHRASLDLSDDQPLTVAELRRLWGSVAASAVVCVVILWVVLR